MRGPAAGGFGRREALLLVALAALARLPVGDSGCTGSAREQLRKAWAGVVGLAGRAEPLEAGGQGKVRPERVPSPEPAGAARWPSNLRWHRQNLWHSSTPQPCGAKSARRRGPALTHGCGRRLSAPRPRGPTQQELEEHAVGGVRQRSQVGLQPVPVLDLQPATGKRQPGGSSTPGSAAKHVCPRDAASCTHMGTALQRLQCPVGVLQSYSCRGGACIVPGSRAAPAWRPARCRQRCSA